MCIITKKTLFDCKNTNNCLVVRIIVRTFANINQWT